MRLGILLAVVALITLPTIATAEEPAVVAADAYDVHQAHCASVAGGSTQAAAESMAEVTEVWQRVIAAYEGSGRTYLLYWRGVLGECLGQAERAGSDLRLFVDLEQFGSADMQPLIRDSRTRLRRMGVEVDRPSDAELMAAREKAAEGGEFSAAAESEALKKARSNAEVPFFLVSGGGGYQRVGDYNYVAIAADLSFGIVGPLRAEVSYRTGASISYTDSDGETADTGTYWLNTLGVGPALEFAGPVRPRVAVLFQLGINPSLVGGPVVLAGVLVSGGVDIPLGRSGVAIRPVVEVGNLGQMFAVRGLAEVVIGIERKRGTRTR